MKKSKIALAAVTAALLATTAGGLAACGGDDGKSKPKGKHEFTIEFDANGGEFAAGTDTPVTRKTSGGMLLAFPDDPTEAPAEHSDYTFKGWALEDDATADDALELPCRFESDDTLYAIWGGEQDISTGAYLITFDAKGGTLATGEETQMTVDGKLATLPTPTNGDKTFVGWYIVDGSTSDSHKVTANVTVFDRATTVYASYTGGTVIPVTESWVTFDGNGGKFDVDGEKQETVAVKTESHKIKTLPTTPARDGYEFMGYYMNADGSGDEFTTETEVTTARLTVYAKWEEVLGDNTYEVTHDGTAQPAANLTDRSAWLKDQTDGRDEMYSIGSDIEKGIELKTGDTIAFKINGEPIKFFLTPASLGVDTSITKTEIEEIKITADDTFVFYLAHYPAEYSSSGKACWSIDVKAEKTEAPKPLHEGSVTVLNGDTTPLIDKTRELGTWNPTADDDKDAELTISFKPGIGKELSFEVDGKKLSFYLEPEATGLTGKTGVLISSVTTETDGTYTLYLKHYPVNPKHSPARTEETWVLAASYTGATTVTKVDGIYVGETLKKKLIEGETNQLKAEHVDFTEGDELTFIIDGKPVDVSMEAGEENSKNIVKESGKLVVKKTGTYTLYYKTNTKELWVTDEGSREDSQLQEGDGLYAGETPIKAFEVNATGVNEIMATGVKLTAETVITLKYGGVELKDFTLKPDSHVDQSVLSGGKLTLAANTYNFYYNYSSKVLYIGIEGGTPVVTKDGLYAGGTQIKAFEKNSGNADEVMATGVKLTEETVITLKYDGVEVKDFTLKPDSHVEQSVLSGGKLTLAANTYNFYYNTATKVLYIGIEGGIVVTPVTPLTKATVGSTDIELKCIKPDSTDKDTEYAAENVTLKKGEKFQLHNGADIPTFWLDGYDGGKTKEALSVVNESVLSSEATVIKSGIYNLYIKHYASGWTVSAVFVKAIDGEIDEPDPVTKKDGIYNGDTIVKEAATHNANEIKFVHVTFKAGDTFTIVYGGKATTAKMKPGDAANPNSSKIEVANGVYKVKTAGMFTMYYQHTGDVGLWVVDEAMSDLQTGDGMIATGVNAPFVINDGGTNEVMAIDVELTAKTALELKYGGVKVTDYTVKNLSEIAGATLASGVLTLPAGTYGFYYNYSTKELYVGVKIDVPAGFVETKGGYQDETHPNVYLVGKYGGLTAITKDYGKLATYTNNDYGYTTFKVTVTLAVGDEIAIWVPDWNFMCATAENGNATHLETVTHDGTTYLKVKTAGTYTFHFKSKSGDDKIYIEYPA